MMITVHVAVALSSALLQPAPPARPVVMSATAGPVSLQREMQRARNTRQIGLASGVGLLGAGLYAGCTSGIIDGWFVADAAWRLAILGGSLGVVNTLRHDEHRKPLPASAFAVRESSSVCDQSGLFAAAPIEAGTYLLDYGGDQLTEDKFFDRYPAGDCRYVAAVGPWYIDGSDPDVKVSGLARWMNHAREAANVEFRKQRFGKVAMHFYAKRRIEAGEELLYDYGDEYWQAAGVQPNEPTA